MTKTIKHETVGARHNNVGHVSRRNVVGGMVATPLSFGVFASALPTAPAQAQ